MLLIADWVAGTPSNPGRKPVGASLIALPVLHTRSRLRGELQSLFALQQHFGAEQQLQLAVAGLQLRQPWL